MFKLPNINYTLCFNSMMSIDQFVVPTAHMLKTTSQGQNKPARPLSLPIREEQSFHFYSKFIEIHNNLT